MKTTSGIFVRSLALACILCAADGASAATPRKASSRSAAAVNTWNPWKKGVTAHKLDAKKPRDADMPWTTDAVKKLDPKLASLQGVELVNAAFDLLKAKYGAQRALDWYEQIVCGRTKIAESRGDAGLWNFYGFKAFNCLDQGRVLQAVGGLKSYCHAKPTWYFAGRGVPSIRMFEQLKTFPRDADKIVFPKENVWVKGKRTVHAKDFGWNAVDATAALAKALADPKADIVVVDKMPSPWLITHVDVPSDKTLVFEDGVRVHATQAEQRSNSKEALFTVKGAENVAFVGKGDATIGKFPDAATRDLYLKEEGGTGLYLDAAKNVLVRDLRISQCGCDGITLGGCGVINSEIYVENVDLDHNARQAMSMCNGHGVYLKNVKFRNTCGAQPMAGIDFEPSIQEVEATCEIYLIDCAFDNNAGGNIVFSESSTYPVTVLFKHCDVGSHNYGAININALCGLYQGNGTDAPSDIIFDACTIKGVSWYPPVTIQNANLFHVTFRNCDIVETAGRPVGVSPFRFCLNREYYSSERGDRTSYQKEGSLAFDNTRVKGWKGSEALSFDDRTGHYSVKGVYGRLLMNGKNVDMTKYRYEAPDFKYKEVAKPKLSALKKSQNAGKSNVGGAVVVSERSPWWVGPAKYEVYSPGGAGYTSEIVDGKSLAGMLSAHPGSSFATRCSDGLFRLSAPTTVYFKVPAGKGVAMAKIVDDELFGEAELLKGREKVAGTYTRKSLKNGYAYIPLKESQKPQVYGFRVTKGTLVFKLFDPCSGLVAESPDALPNSD